MLKLGAGWSAALGSGVVVARRPCGGWSAPSALLAASTGLGWQLGAELADVLVVLRSPAAVRAFCGAQLGVGGAASVAAGWMGRAASASAAASTSGAGATMVSWSMSKGLFAGVALEAALLCERAAVNHAFYGRRLSAQQLLAGDAVAPPAGASSFYAALEAFLSAVAAPSEEEEAAAEAQAAAALASSDLEAGGSALHSCGAAVAAALGVPSPPVACAPASQLGGLQGFLRRRAPAAEAACSAPSAPVYHFQQREEEGPWGTLFD